MASTNQFNSGDMISFTLDLNAKYVLILHYVLTKTNDVLIEIVNFNQNFHDINRLSSVFGSLSLPKIVSSQSRMSNGERRRCFSLL